MGRRKKLIPEYGTVTLNGIEYFRTRIEDADGKRVALYAKTAEELYEKVEEAKPKGSNRKERDWTMPILQLQLINNHHILVLHHNK